MGVMAPRILRGLTTHDSHESFLVVRGLLTFLSGESLAYHFTPPTFMEHSLTTSKCLVDPSTVPTPQGKRKRTCQERSD
jgi:hypothetical protein